MTSIEFIKVYNKYKLNKFAKFVFKILNDNMFKSIITIFLLVAFFIGAIGVMTETKLVYIILPYAVTLFIIGITGLVAFLMKRYKEYRIMKELDIDVETYNFFVQRYIKW